MAQSVKSDKTTFTRNKSLRATTRSQMQEEISNSLTSYTSRVSKAKVIKLVKEFQSLEMPAHPTESLASSRMLTATTDPLVARER